MNLNGGMDRDEAGALCDRCAHWFHKDRLVEEDEMMYCLACYDTLVSTEMEREP